MSSVNITNYQLAALCNPCEHFAFFGGVGAGKTFIGSHFVIKQIEEHPDKTGLIGSNSYDQLSQATLRELFYWLDEYGYDYVVDQRPPNSWGERRQFKTYKNVLSVRAKSKNKVVTIFTRVMGSANPLRGIEFSWYWLDETRDTPQDTHDVVLSRMREQREYRKGLITSTTNGEDWAYSRFACARRGQRLYGSMHVATIKAVQKGILSPSFYNSLLMSYSPLMALQELDAKHVNVRGGIAYYAASDRNKMVKAPWGDEYPDRDRPLAVGCDFNFQPAPCVWMVGQVGPNEDDGNGGTWSEHIHWFGEISDTQVSSRQMALKLIGQYPDFFYEIIGDASGGRGTTSNAGEHDYNQIADELSNAQCLFTIDYDQANPRVKDRVENSNRLLKDATGFVRQTYNPVACPLFDADMRMVGWKKTIEKGRGKLDDGGDKKLTHASDGAGYWLFKKFPPGRRGQIIESVPSSIRQDMYNQN